MRSLGISVPSRSGLSPARVAEAARAAEAAGCAAFFVSERVADAVALSAVALAATETITVGTAIANAVVRNPALTAMTAATFAEAYRGRFWLGLGVANRRLNHEILGVPRIESELTFLRSYVSTLRNTWAGAGIELDRPARQVPLHLAGLLPRMLQLAGEIGDGVVLNLATVARLPSILADIATGARRVGRDPASVSVSCLVPTCLSDDSAAAAAAARQVVLGYAQHPAARQLFHEAGFGPDIEAIVVALVAGDTAAATELVSDDLAAAFVVYGDRDECRNRIEAYRAAGVHLPILFPMPVAGDWDGAVERALALAAEDEHRAALSRKDAPCSNVPMVSTTLPT